MASQHISIPGLARYDVLFLGALLIQALLLLMRIETLREALVLAGFHIIGLILELFKTHPAIGSWSYPEEGMFKLATVPLYSGFMYAAVASYLCQAWRLLAVRLHHYPSYYLSLPLSLLIYGNFFAHHFVFDLRWVLIALVVLVFWRCRVSFVTAEQRRDMPLVLAFALIGFFIWIAENISTYLGAWVYPSQHHAWTLVSLGKISSWFLLVIISFIIVADLKHRRAAGRVACASSYSTISTPCQKAR